MTAVVWYVIRTVAGSSSWLGWASQGAEQIQNGGQQPTAGQHSSTLPARQLHFKMISRHYHYHFNSYASLDNHFIQIYYFTNALQ